MSGSEGSKNFSYVTDIKKKYGIKNQEKSKLITLDDYEQGQRNIRIEIDELFKDSVVCEPNQNVYKKAYDTFIKKNGDYRIVELWEDLSPGTYIKGLSKDSKKIVRMVQGFVCGSSPKEIWVKSMKESKRIKSIGRQCLILTKYNDSQMTALNLNRMALQGMKYTNKKQNLVINLDLV